METSGARRATGLQPKGGFFGHGPFAFGCRQPVLQFQVTAGGLDTLPTSGLARLDRLLGTELGSPFVATERSLQRALVERLTAWTTVVLQRASHPVLEPPRRVDAGPDGAVGVLQPCLDLKACAQVVNLLLVLVNHALDLARDDASLDTAVEAARSRWAELLPRSGLQGFNTVHFVQAAHELQIPWRQLRGNLIVLGQGVHARWLYSSWTDRTGAIASQLAKDKRASADVLRESGLPVPPHVLADDADSAVRHAGQLGYPVVIKPADRDGGEGVKAGLQTADEVRQAFAEARRKSRLVLVEKHVPGRDYRLQVVQGEVQGVLERVPGGVVGNGVDTVETLLLRQNEERRTATDDRRFLHAMALDDEAGQQLARQGLDRHAVPAPGVVVRLRGASNVASGGVPVELPLERVHPDNLRLAVRAARALRLDVAGIDLLIPDIGDSWLDTGAHICEVNARPQMFTTMHKPMLNRMFNGTRGRIPVAVVLDASGQGLHLGRQLHRCLLDRGVRAGLAQGTELWLGEDRVGAASPDCLRGAGMLLLDNELQALVIAVGLADLAVAGWPVADCELVLLCAAGDSGGPGALHAAFGQALARVRDLRPAAVWVDATDTATLQQARVMFAPSTVVQARAWSSEADRQGLALQAARQLVQHTA